MPDTLVQQRTKAVLGPNQREVLENLQPLVSDLTRRHKRKRRLWYPSELLPADEQMSHQQLRDLETLPERARGLPDAVRVSLALNLLTEEGLPHFHRLISYYLGPDSVWAKWNSMWTAEEDRHGCVIRDYVRAARLYHSTELEKLQYLYIEAGFHPNWESNPYRLLAYTSLQERATQVAHGNTGRMAREYDPAIANILDKVSSDEARHHAFYRGVFQGIVELDPNGALDAALAVISSFSMPGHTMPGYDAMAEVVYKSGIYGPWEYKTIVEEVLKYWNIGHLTDLDAHGRESQDALMALPKRLEKVAGYMDRRSRPKTYSFPFIYNRTVEMG